MKNRWILVPLALLLAVGCSEEKITPTPGNEQVKGAYILPQGSHDFDDDIVEFATRTNTVPLYIFNQQDFGWNVTSNITWMETPAGSSVTPSRFAYRPAAPDKVGAQFALFKSKFADYYPDQALKEFLPRVVMMAGEIAQIAPGYEGTLEAAVVGTDKTVYNAYFTVYNMLLGGGDALPTEPAAVNLFSADLNYGFLKWLTDRGKINPSAAFFVTSYSSSISTGNAVGLNGLLDHADRNNPETDYRRYLEKIVSMTEAEFAAAYLSNSYDRNTKKLVRQKYNAVLATFAAHGIDLKKIGNDREAE